MWFFGDFPLICYFYLFKKNSVFIDDQLEPRLQKMNLKSINQLIIALLVLVNSICSLSIITNDDSKSPASGRWSDRRLIWWLIKLTFSQRFLIK